MKKHLHILFPLCLAVYPPLLYYSRNISLFPPDQILVTTGVVVLVAALLWGISYLIVRNGAEASAAAGISVFLLLVNAHYQGVLRFAGVAPQDVSRLLYQLPWHAVVLLAAISGVRLLRRFPGVQSPTILASIVLVLFPLTSLVSSYGSAKEIRQKLEAKRSPGAPRAKFTGQGTLPNVVLLVLDGYGRADMLRELYGFDNRPFIDALRQRGFEVAERSRSNYGITMLSLSSAFNMLHPRDMERAYGLSLRGWEEYYGLFKQAELWRIARELGYSVASFDTHGFFPLTSSDRFLPVSVESPMSQLSFAQQTSYVLFEKLVRMISPSSESGDVAGWRNHTLSMLAQAADLSYSRKPVFVYAHCISPHPPFVHADEGMQAVPFSDVCIDGTDFHEKNNSDESYYISAYTQQIRKLNRHVLAAVDRIIAAPRPVAIIIISDHGPGAYLNFHAPATSNHYERLSNLVAVRSPGKTPLPLPDDITLINLFPLILHSWYGISIPMQQDRSYSITQRSPRFNPSVDLLDVTDTLDRIEAGMAGRVP